MTQTRRLTICNKLGLHARAAARFAETATRFDAEITVSRDGASVSGRSLMGLLMLAASDGCEIDVSAEGAEAEAALDALADLVARRFGEKS